MRVDTNAAIFAYLNPCAFSEISATFDIGIMPRLGKDIFA